LEYATDKKAEVVGKPEKTFFLEAIRDLGIDVENTVMIGDVNICILIILIKFGIEIFGDS